MSNKTPISNANTYQNIGAFWDEHDATEFGKQNEVQFEVNIQSQCRYFPLDKDLSLQTRQIAKQQGVSEEILLNLWIQEKINQTKIVEKTYHNIHKI